MPLYSPSQRSQRATQAQQAQQTAVKQQQTEVNNKQAEVNRLEKEIKDAGASDPNSINAAKRKEWEANKAAEIQNNSTWMTMANRIDSHFGQMVQSMISDTSRAIFTLEKAAADYAYEFMSAAGSINQHLMQESVDNKGKATQKANETIRDLREMISGLYRTFGSLSVHKG